MTTCVQNVFIWIAWTQKTSSLFRCFRTSLFCSRRRYLITFSSRRCRRYLRTSMKFLAHFPGFLLSLEWIMPAGVRFLGEVTSIWFGELEGIIQVVRTPPARPLFDRLLLGLPVFKRRESESSPHYNLRANACNGGVSAPEVFLLIKYLTRLIRKRFALRYVSVWQTFYFTKDRLFAQCQFKVGFCSY